MEQLRLSLRFIYVFIAITLLTSCGKDEVLPHEVSIEEIQSSFFRVAESTVMLPENTLTPLIVSKENGMLILRNDPAIDSLQVGGVIMTDLETEGDKIIFRKVLSKDNNGSEITLETIPATLEQAFSAYYIDTKKPGVLTYRDEVFSWNLKDFEGDARITAVRKALEIAIKEVSLGKIQSPRFKVETEGVVDVTMLHPHVAFYQYGQAVRPEIWENIEENAGIIITDFLTVLSREEVYPDTDGDGVANVIEEVYGSSITDPLSIPNFKRVDIDNFKFNQLAFDMDYDLKPAAAADTSYAKNQLETIASGAAIASIISGFELGGETNIDPGLPTMRYFSSPFPPPFSLLNGSFLVYYDMGGSVNMSAGFNMNIVSTESVDISFGYLEPGYNPALIQTTLDGVDASIEYFNQDGTKTTLPSYFYNSTDLDMNLLLKASAQAKVGAGIGFSIGVGEANNAGASVGMIFGPNLYIEGQVEAGIKIDGLAQDLSNFNADGGLFKDNFHLQACADLGIGLEAYAFFDANLAGWAFADAADLKYKLVDSKQTLMPQFMAGVNEKYELGIQNLPQAPPFCFPSDCNGAIVNNFTIAEQTVGSQKSLLLNYKVSAIGTSYNLNIKDPVGNLITSIGSNALGQPQERTLNDDANSTQDVYDQIIFYKDELILEADILATNGQVDCTHKFNSYLVLEDCQQVSDWNSDIPEFDYTNTYVTNLTNADINGTFVFERTYTSGSVVQYMTKQDAATACAKMGGRLPNGAEANQFYHASGCFHPTGWMSPSTLLTSITTSNDPAVYEIEGTISDNQIFGALDAYDTAGFWIDIPGSTNNLYYYNFEKGTGLEEVTSEELLSFYAPCLCVK